MKRVLHEFSPTGSSILNVKHTIQTWANLDAKLSNR